MTDPLQHPRRPRAPRRTGWRRGAPKRQHEAGKLTARERIELLFDPGTFEEVDKLVTHRCRDFGMDEPDRARRRRRRGPWPGRRPARCSRSRRTSRCSAARCRRPTPRRSCKVMDLAMKLGAPIVGLNDSGGARIQEGVALARRLRRHLPPQHAGVGRRPADLARSWGRARAAPCTRPRSPTSS